MMIGRNDQLAPQVGFHCEAENELARPCVRAKATPMAPRPTSTITLRAALRLGTHLLSHSGSTPMPTITQMRTSTRIAALKLLMLPQKTEARVPANSTNTLGAQ